MDWALFQIQSLPLPFKGLLFFRQSFFYKFFNIRLFFYLLFHKYDLLVANDLDTARSTFTYGSNPIGIELQVTTFGYNSELLKDVVFKKFKIIKKSPNEITDMYLSYWADVDLGYAMDDRTCFDSTYNHKPLWLQLENETFYHYF
ncbi:MAG: hypothetical protein HGB11_09545 [Chlorobiales bacterium]|nr:hypothetical protein [Chlorobiales bacterium]